MKSDDGAVDKTDRTTWKFDLQCTEHPRDRDQGLLTYDDREYLFGEKDVTKESEAQLRHRMRNRIENGMLDFELLLYHLNDHDYQIIFDNMLDLSQSAKSRRAEFHHSSGFALAFLYYGITEYTNVNFGQLVENAIEIMGKRRPKTADNGHTRYPIASVDIDINWEEAISPDHALERLRNGEVLTDREIGTLVRQGDLTEEDWQRLQDIDPAEDLAREITNTIVE